MPVISLPDGSQRQFDKPVSIAEVAADIGPGLAKAALAGAVDGKLVDTSYRLEDDAAIRIITDRDEEGLEIIRHSTAHLLAQAVQDLFPGAQVTIGPVIEDGFYYDFAYERSFTPEDLQAIEQRMQELSDADLEVSRSVWDREKAVQTFREMGEEYKAEIIADLPADEPISIYSQGEWMDLCRGPHVPSTGKLKHFKLMKVAGAYWRGNSDNEMLQRIYGTAWTSKKDLNAYLHRLEEAEKRDHRKLGRKFDLFHLQEEAPGMVFWHPKGWSIYTGIQQYIRGIQNDNGYQEINTPIVVDRSLWERSGHWDKFRDDMFTVESESRDYAIKPMNCPCHVQIFNQGLRSYRDLPLRLAEFGSCSRNEASGTLHGLMRVRGFVQDDAHIFCTEDQIHAEAKAFIELFYQVYEDFGFKDIDVKISTRPEQRVGSDEVWDKSERIMEDVLKELAIDYGINPGEGAFYGPKYEFVLRDSIGRQWQLGTFQLDFSMPGRLGAQYVAEDGSRQTPVMLHRAILGSFERFIGILIEHYEGSFPAWLAPEQVAVLNITDRQHPYAEKIANLLRQQGFRVNLDLRNEKIGFKIREHTIQRIPYLLVLGDREMQEETVTVRSRGGEDLGTMSLENFVERLREDVDRRGRIF